MINVDTGRGSCGVYLFVRENVEKFDFYRAMHFSAKRGIAIVYCLSVCPSVTFRYHDHIGWNSSKIISRPNSLRPLLGLTPTWAIWCLSLIHI